MVITETVNQGESTFDARQVFVPRKGIKVHFYATGKSISEAMANIVPQVAKYCTLTGIHPAQIIDSKTYINNMGAGHAH